MPRSILTGICSLTAMGLVAAILTHCPSMSFIDPSQTKDNEIPIEWRGNPPNTTLREAEQIFKKAFWRRPTEEDEILRAVRHEWNDEDGLQRWQWFLAVKASLTLSKYLIEDNAFALMRSGSFSLPDEVPSWFRFNEEAFIVLESADRSMQLFYNQENRTLYATARGRGFARGADAPLPAQSGPNQGRLPASSPSGF